nr:hypothetical protein [Massilia sp. Se16.2.3]
MIVGDPRQVADELLTWFDETGIDGFNLAYALAKEDMRNVVELVVPELRRRGRYRVDEAGADSATTLRERLLGTGPRLQENHPGRQVRIDIALRPAA